VTRLFNTLFIVAFAALMALMPAAAQEENNSQMSPRTPGALPMKDPEFVKKAAQSGLAEVELGQLATQKATNPEVKQFAQRMVDDHTKANEQLKQVAQQEQIKVPDTVDAKDKAKKDKLEKLSGAKFDRAYMADMVKDHKKDVSDFRSESKNAKSPAVKNFAAQTLPTLEDHLKQAQQVESTIKATGDQKASR
jgi:putative membrane protein